MTHTRRRFLATSGAAAGAVALGPARALAASPGPADPTPSSPAPVASSPRPLRILILGGTGFIGPHQVRYAMYRATRSASSTGAAPPRISSPAWRR